MNNTIWKFALKIDDDNYIEMPRNAEILSVGLGVSFAFHLFEVL